MRNHTCARKSSRFCPSVPTARSQADLGWSISQLLPRSRRDPTTTRKDTRFAKTWLKTNSVCFSYVPPFVALSVSR